MRKSIDASKLTTLAARQTETSRLPVIAMAVALMAAPATFAQKSKQLQKRENYEFTFDLPRYVEQLKKELTYPLAWENAHCRFRRVARQGSLKGLRVYDDTSTQGFGL